MTNSKHWRKVKKLRRYLDRDWQALKRESALSTDEIVEGDAVDLILFLLIKKGII